MAVVEVFKSSECSALNTDNFIQKQIWLLVLSALIQGGSVNPIRVFLNPGSVPLCFLVLYEAFRFHADLHKRLPSGTTQKQALAKCLQLGICICIDIAVVASSGKNVLGIDLLVSSSISNC